ncbi:hypothetical protein J6590_080876 [Homalodisca vitripennis]|nr:hypothetical protein J6590_070943 [Homalodisca vitripennis]KAG8290446.1 hypothetical protein J6590_080876 [Homalodisca vitripennis]
MIWGSATPSLVHHLGSYLAEDMWRSEVTSECGGNPFDTILTGIVQSWLSQFLAAESVLLTSYGVVVGGLTDSGAASGRYGSSGWERAAPARQSIVASLEPLRPPFMYWQARQFSLNSPPETGGRSVYGLRLACQFGLFRQPVIERKSFRPSGWPENNSGKPRVWEFPTT